MGFSARWNGVKGLKRPVPGVSPKPAAIEVHHQAALLRALKCHFDLCTLPQSDTGRRCQGIPSTLLPERIRPWTKVAGILILESLCQHVLGGLPRPAGSFVLSASSIYQSRLTAPPPPLLVYPTYSRSYPHILYDAHILCHNCLLTCHSCSGQASSLPHRLQH